MKYLKESMIILVALLLTSSTFGQSAEKTLVKSFNLKGQETIVLDLKGDVEVKEWKGEIMRVQMSIAINNGSNSMLKSLITAGRYNLKSKVENEEMRIFAPGMERDIKIKGSALQEKIVYTVFAPEDINIKMVDDVSSDVKNSAPLSSSL
ncbi:MAG: hypothetical protein AAF985_24285 [Bacteroidota bacterium]